jgi:MYXO-CTERM domain-containing protein
MTERTDSIRRAAAALAIGATLSLSSFSASAATLKSHKHHPPSPTVQKEWAAFEKALKKWESQLGGTSATQFLRTHSLTNSNGTLKNHVLSRLLGQSSPSTTSTAAASSATTPTPAAASVMATSAKISAQSQSAQTVGTISAAPKSSMYQVLIPPDQTPTASTPAPAQQELSPTAQTVPEPSAIASALAIVGLVGLWSRRRRPRG